VLQVVNGGAHDVASEGDERQRAGASALLDLLTTLWAAEILAGQPLTDGAGAAHDGGEETGPPRCWNTTTAPDPQS
jgi:hypothetical protein